MRTQGQGLNHMSYRFRVEGLGFRVQGAYLGFIRLDIRGSDFGSYSFMIIFGAFIN